MNVELLLKAKAAILASPEAYDQWNYCGTACCIAGHVVAIGDPELWRMAIDSPGWHSDELVCCRAQELLGMKASDYEVMIDCAYDWPLRFRVAYAHAENDAERATVAAECIDYFIGKAGAR